MSQLNPLNSSSYLDPFGIAQGDSGIFGSKTPYQVQASPYTAPGFNPLFDMSKLQGELNAIPTNMQGINAYRSQALRTGPSTWASLQKTNNAAKQASQKEQVAQEGVGQTAQALDQLAASGGLSSGARERAVEGGQKNVMDMQQNLAREGNLNDIQTNMNDESNRIQQLGQLPGMENEATKPLFEKSQILTNAQGQNNAAQNAYNQNLYNQQNQAWYAGQQANATAASGKK